MAGAESGQGFAPTIQGFDPGEAPETAVTEPANAKTERTLPLVYGHHDMNVELPTFVTLSGAARELRICNDTLKRRVANGEVTPDGVLVETAGRPGSILFASASLPAIAAKLSVTPKKS